MDTTPADSNTPSIVTDGQKINEFLTFCLGQEEYGVEILKVQEIRSYENPTTIANSPEFIKGVINLRGTIVPIIDMRVKFNLGNVVYDPLTVVVILNVLGRVIGIVVDSVSDVVSLTPEQIRAAPELGTAIDIRYVIGLGTAGERMLILIDIEKFMSSEDMKLIDNTRPA